MPEEKKRSSELVVVAVKLPPVPVELVFQNASVPHWPGAIVPVFAAVPLTSQYRLVACAEERAIRTIMAMVIAIRIALMRFCIGVA